MKIADHASLIGQSLFFQNPQLDILSQYSSLYNEIADLFDIYRNFAGKMESYSRGLPLL